MTTSSNSNSWRRALTVFALLLVCGCGGDDGPSEPSGLDTPEAYTSRGWERFEDGNGDGALDDFEAALDLEALNGPALAGLGWARLIQADSTAKMQDAQISFEAAIAQGENGAYVLAGQAAARLGTGAWAAAVTDAQAAIVASPGFVFEHRTSFNSNDLFLIVAIAEASSGDLDGALAAADTIQDSGIDPDNSASWTVGGANFGTYAAAVLAHLSTLSNTYAG